MHDKLSRRGALKCLTDGPGTEFFARYGQPSNNRGYYSFDA